MLEPSKEISNSLRFPTPQNEKSLLDHPHYLAEGVIRIPVSADKVPWSVPWDEYDSIPQKPYNHSIVLKEYEAKGESGWAAAPDARMYHRDVRSYVEKLPVNEDGEVLNPGGRTGIKDGRGLLGKPGPNFAADPIIFRIHPTENKLQVLLIQRDDTFEWAIPGGMVEFGEKITKTLRRELGEESGVKIPMNDTTVIYQGYVDDPRNTDKAWMETTAAFKLLTPEEARTIKLKAGSDAKAAKWADVTEDLLGNLYASHGRFIRIAITQLPVRYAEELVAISEHLAPLLTFEEQASEQ